MTVFLFVLEPIKSVLLFVLVSKKSRFVANEDGVVDVANGDVVEIIELLLAGKTNLSVKDSSNFP